MTIETKFGIGEKVSFLEMRSADDYCPHCDRGDSTRHEVCVHGIVEGVQYERSTISYLVRVKAGARYVISEDKIISEETIKEKSDALYNDDRSAEQTEISTDTPGDDVRR